MNNHILVHRVSLSSNNYLNIINIIIGKFFLKKIINNSLGEDEDNVNNNADRGLN